jgi:hypothetical protein
LRATTRGDSKSTIKDVTVAVCQLPGIVMEEGSTVKEDYDGKSGSKLGDYETAEVVEGLASIFTVHKCGICTATFAILDGDGVPAEHIVVDENNNLVVDT